MCTAAKIAARSASEEGEAAGDQIQTGEPTKTVDFVALLVATLMGVAIVALVVATVHLRKKCKQNI